MGPALALWGGGDAGCPLPGTQRWFGLMAFLPERSWDPQSGEGEQAP